MAGDRQKFNPFYGLVVLLGAVFAVTAIAYTLGLVVSLRPPEVGPGVAVESSGFFRFLDRRGEGLLMAEIAGLTVTSLAAMGLDRWRSWRGGRIDGVKGGGS